MKYSLKKLFLNEQNNPPNFLGNPSFGGTGNYGMSGDKQLAATHRDPITQAVLDQDKEETNQNIKDLNWRLGKYSLGGEKNPIGPSDTKPTEIKEQDLGDNSTSRQRDLPGWPKMNTLVNPKQHTPQDVEDVEYLGPTLGGAQILDNKHS